MIKLNHHANLIEAIKVLNRRLKKGDIIESQEVDTQTAYDENGISHVYTETKYKPKIVGEQWPYDESNFFLGRNLEASDKFYR